MYLRPASVRVLIAIGVLIQCRSGGAFANDFEQMAG